MTPLDAGSPTREAIGRDQVPHDQPTRDDLPRALADAARNLARANPANQTGTNTGSHPAGDRLVILVDGGSGAGKTTLARQLVVHLRRERPATQLVSLDDCYPGWEGLAAGAAMIPDMLRAHDPGHPTWDWVAHRTSGWVGLDPQADIVIEGCGALTPTNRALADVGVWVELDEQTRKQQALDRDGEGYRPWWDLWAAQERDHWLAHRPRGLADIVVDFSAGAPLLRW
ncbi:cobalt ABC transporter [Aestuariimicrobium sp. Y1814]|uniref:cobalt ABC transporter n=1 Tax=Aestuariimicrobium sp. Y1814 TaxID=3418742 RepID=UPI003DA707AD